MTRSFIIENLVIQSTYRLSIHKIDKLLIMRQDFKGVNMIHITSNQHGWQ